MADQNGINERQRELFIRKSTSSSPETISNPCFL